MAAQHYPVEPGRLYAGEYPGHRDHNIAKARLRELVEEGVRTFVDLTSPEDAMMSYQEPLRELGLQLKRIDHPITDMGVPSSAKHMQEILLAIEDEIEAGRPVYLHCWGGIGRTGTAIGCWLRRKGRGSQEALDEVRNLYHGHMQKASRLPDSPQTEEQREFVRHWGG